MTARPFLTARWEDLALITYGVDAGLIAPALPDGLEPDRLPDDAPGSAYVSLVAFRFLDTRVRGIPAFFHRDFPEVNLRTYVRTTGGESPRRGVLFLQELVPRWLVTTIANRMYREHYKTVPMHCTAGDGSDGRRRHYTRIETGGRMHEILLTGDLPAVSSAPGSTEHFFKEHTWGFGADRQGKLTSYRVDHPPWQVYPVDPASDLTLRVDFGRLYGEPWGALDGRDPDHVMYAVGSAVAVFPQQAGDLHR